VKNFESHIKEYSTRDFIYAFSDISIAMFKKQMKSNSEPINCCMIFHMNAILHGFIPKQVEVLLSSWDVHAMEYLSIINAGDYRNNSIQLNEFASIVNLYREYENENSGSEYLKAASLQNVFKYFMGITYEQFKYQNLSWVIQNFNRNYHMLIGSKKINRSNITDINEITQLEFGMTAAELLTVELIVLWLCSQHPDPLSAPEELYCKKSTTILTKENLRKVIEYYSVTYDEVRNSPLGKQIFYSKPFVITNKTREYIASNFYLVIMLMGDGLYWLVRDYYLNNQGGQKFVNAFGEMFEDYFEELATLYLPKKAWHKIPQGKEKSADYFVEFEDVIFLFEQKSGLLGIGAKQQNPDLQQIDKFYDRNIREAYQQLKNSEKQYEGSKPVIKIFLLYENLTNTQIVMSSIPEIFDVDSTCFIMTIQDLEMMFAIYKENQKKFKLVVESLINDENSRMKYKSVLDVLIEKKAIENLHFVEERDYFSKIMKELEIELNN